MSGTFEIFHLSLVERLQGELFDNPSLWTREKWIAHAFSNRFQFSHRGNDFHWVPMGIDGILIAGNVVRSHLRIHHTPPDEGAEEVASKEWQGALVVIDPSHHDDGQKLSFERDQIIGRPSAVLSSMISYINNLSIAPYVIEPKPIFNQDSFWNWAAAHQFKLKHIVFDFVVPNMWDSKSELDEDLKSLGRIGVQTARVKLESKDGIDANGQQVRDGVEYSAKGGGSITAKAKNGDNFRSTNDPKTTKIPATSAERAGGFRVISQWFQKILGREQGNLLDGPDRDGNDSAVD